MFLFPNGVIGWLALLEPPVRQASLPVNLRGGQAFLPVKQRTVGATEVAGTVLMLMLMLLLTAGAALAFDPPRIIGVLTSPLEDQNGFATDFCWAGDQNGDGFDDLIVNQDRNDTLNRVYLFRGGNPMVNEPAFTFTSYESSLIVGRETVFLGHVLDGPDRVAFFTTKRNTFFAVDQYILGNEPNNNPLNGMRGVQGEGASHIQRGYMKRPFDFNGDGFNDFVFMKQVPPTATLQVSYGGEKFDTLPDWESDPKVTMGLSGDVRISGGCDINGDDFDDILVYTRGDANYYSLYLGGNPPDTIPAVRFRANDYNLGDIFAMLPDVNADDYDDWGISWLIGGEVDENWEGGIKVFFGGEEPDSEPDLTLNSEPLRGLGIGGLCGGDFNGDGKGDVVYTDGGGYNQPVERMSIHFGNRWLNDGHQPDIYVSNMMREYGYESAFRLGAVGDYNGDGVDDFVAYLYTYLEDHYEARGLAIFAGNRGWRVDVLKETSTPVRLELDLTITPNPFNDTAIISYFISRSTKIKLSLYDTQGRLLRILTQGDQSVGKQILTIDPPVTGLYLLVLQADNQRIIRKIVSVQ